MLNPSVEDTRIGGTHTPVSAISWPAIIAGSFAAAAISIVLILLGSGLGLASASPYGSGAMTAGKFTAAMAVWLIVMQWVSSGLGGYITGRLRTRWNTLHEHEVFFRDTAHGFVTWSVATVFVALSVFSTASGVVGSGVQSATAVTSAGVAGAASKAADSSSASDPMAYVTDTLFRSNRPAAANSQEAKVEAGRIFAKGVSDGTLANGDKTYLDQLVASQTGLSQADASTRVDTAMQEAVAVKEKAKEMADTARKSAASLAIFTALAMLVGAFIACLAAVMGGHRRDVH